MFMRKFFVVFVVGCSMQICAMEQEAVMVQPMVQEPIKMVDCERTVRGVAIQVRPGYVAGTKVFVCLSGEEAINHERAVSRISTECKARSFSPVKDLGVYFIDFKEPISLARVQELCKALPGFEKVYDINDYVDRDSTIKETIFNRRVSQLDNTKKLRTFKKLSASQLVLPKQKNINY